MPLIIDLVILVLNIGNTNIAYGYVRGGELGATGHEATPATDIDAAIEMLVDRLISNGYQTDTHRVEIAAASVVPAVTQALREVCARRRFDLLVADETVVPGAVGVASAATAGDDRLVNAFAAARLYGTPAIVVDLGTATTFDVVDADGQFMGGAIAPGIGLGLDALATRTAQLPRVRLSLPRNAIGRGTLEAIQSGTVLGHVGMVEFLVRAITAEVGENARPKVVLTGGLSAHEWAKSINGVDAIDPLLTLRGLALLQAERAAAVPSA